MARYWFILCFSLFIFGRSSCQSARTIWSHYNAAQQRWLTLSTGQFIYTVAQGQIDFDSAVLYACKMYGAGRLLPYQDGFAAIVSSPGRNLIEDGKIKEARDMVERLSGQQQLRLLIELSNYFVHKPGADPLDLDSAFSFVNRAQLQCYKPGMEKWLYDCLSLKGLIYTQQNEPLKSRESFLSIIEACKRRNDTTSLVLANEYFAKSLPVQDPLKLIYLNESLKSYDRLNQKIKQLEVLAAIVNVQFIKNWTLAEKAMQQYFSLLKAAGFQHLSYSQYTLSYFAAMKGDLTGSLSYLDQAIANMRLTGDSSLSCLFYSRLGTVYQDMGDDTTAMHWLKMALDTRTRQPQIFWYNSIFTLARLLENGDKLQESLDYIHSITRKYPPTTTFSRMHLYWVNAIFYDALNRNQLAETNYNLFISLAHSFPKEHIHGEFPDAYYRIAHFYFKMGRNAISRLYAQKALTINPAGIFAVDASALYHLLFQLDSASGNYKSAMLNHIQYKFFSDSVFSLLQRKQVAEMNVKYNTEKKNKDITSLQQQAKLQQLALAQSGRLRNITLVAAAMLLAIVFLLYRQYRLKQRSNRTVQKKNTVLQRMVNEKEWLLKEVHHRVKNNLQTIVSLLELQSEYLHDEALSAIHNSQNRIYSMSLIHKKLYQADNVAAINMQAYLFELVNYLQELYDATDRIEFQTLVSPVSLDVSQAVPIGLIVNEAVTNSIKYAFSSGIEKPRIVISLKQRDDGWELVVCDNGIGFITGSNANKTGGLGMKLIKALTEDLDGQLTIETDNGTAVKIYFHVEQPLMSNHNNQEQLLTHI